MLRITVELLPGGREASAVVIGRGTIANISDLAEFSDYECVFEENAWRGQVRGPYLAQLQSWPRNDRGLWEMVHAVLGRIFALDATQRITLGAPTRNKPEDFGNKIVKAKSSSSPSVRPGNDDD